ncbi:class I SAM-dependent methyltransferase [Lapillicoccus sp.]|uniref:class I SAM-dependent methyltransferase n=1 Tax=Lapillicoccus sp. TaxID=1909287 RepID=UPI0039832649
MDEQRRRVRGLFDALAETYDQVGVEFFAPIAEGLVSALAPQPGEHALDLGCGRGAALLPIARAVGPTGRALGGDLSPHMVAQCRQLAAAEGLDQVEVRELDAQEPVLPDDGHPADLDLISSSLVVFFLPDPLAALGRWLPLLRPGGRVGISTFAGQDPAWAHVEEVFRPYLTAEMLDARTSGRAGPFASDDGVEELLQRAGYTDVRTTHLHLGVHFTDPEHWYRFSMSVGQRAFWAAVPEGERPAIKDEAQRRLADLAADDGSLHFAQDVRYTLGFRHG